MAKLSAHSTYVRIVGEVAIAWNRLERRLDSLIFQYFTVDAHVAGFVLGEMRNATKAEFAKFLIERFEENPLLREHGLYFANLVNRIRENRNILEHAQPWTYADRYQGLVFKADKRGFEVEYHAPMQQLKLLLKTMQDAAPYARWVTFCLHMEAGKTFDGINGGPTTAEAALRVLASLDIPQTPDKIEPLRLLKARKDARDRRQPSRTKR